MENCRVWKESDSVKGPVLLRMINDGSGVMIVAVDCHGDRLMCGNIAKIDSRGITLPLSVNESVSIARGSGRAIKVY